MLEYIFPNIFEFFFLWKIYLVGAARNNSYQFSYFMDNFSHLDPHTVYTFYNNPFGQILKTLSLSSKIDFNYFCLISFGVSGFQATLIYSCNFQQENLPKKIVKF